MNTLPRLALLGLLGLLAPACFWESTETADGESSTGSQGDGAEGATRAYSNGDPLNWLTDDAKALALEDEVLRLTNEHRASMGLGSLRMVQSLRQVARGHSRHMRKDVHSFFAHTNPEGDTPGMRLTANGVHWEIMAENIGAGALSPQAVMQGWLDSPGHRKNIESPRYTKIGVGWQPGAPGDDPDYWTQVFAD
jgi:uncharacterized protein YkwD